MQSKVNTPLGTSCALVFTMCIVLSMLKTSACYSQESDCISLQDSFKHYANSDILKAKDFASQSYTLSLHSKDKLCEVNSLLNILKVHAIKGNADSANTYYALLVAQKNLPEFDTLQARAAIILSAVHINSFKNDEGIALLEPFLARKDLKPDDRVKILVNIGNAWTNKKEYDKTIQCLLTADSIASDYPISLKNKGDINALLGTTYYNTQNYADAALYIRNAIRDRKAAGLNHMLAYDYIILSKSQIELDNFSEAKIALDSSGIYLESSPGHAGALEAAWGHYYQGVGDHTMAIEHFQKAMAMYEKNKSNYFWYSSAKSLMYSMMIEGYTQGYSSIILDLRANAAKTIKSLDSLHIMQYEVIETIGQSDTQQAKNLINLFVMGHRISKEAKERDLNEVLKKYQADKADLENANLRQANDLQTTRLKAKNYQLGFAGLGSLALLMLIGLLYQRYKERNRANEMLELKNQRIQTLNREIIHRTKNQLEMAANLISAYQLKGGDHDRKDWIEESESRMRALNSVNRRLTVDNDYTRTNLRETLLDILEGNIFSFSGKLSKEVSLQMEMPDIYVDAERAAIIGLVINELSVNSLKHAFGHNEDPVISLKASQNGVLEIVYADSGTGPTTDQQEPGHLGQSLLLDLLRQIEATYQINDTSKYQWTIQIPNTHEQQS